MSFHPPFVPEKQWTCTVTLTHEKANEQTKHLKLQRPCVCFIGIRKHLQVNLDQRMKKKQKHYSFQLSFLNFFLFYLYPPSPDLYHICIGPNVFTGFILFIGQFKNTYYHCFLFFNVGHTHIVGGIWWQRAYLDWWKLQTGGLPRFNISSSCSWFVLNLDRSWMTKYYYISTWLTKNILISFINIGTLFVSSVDSSDLQTK